MSFIRRFVQSITVLTIALSGSAIGAEIFSANSDKGIPDQYIVVLKEQSRLSPMSAGHFVASESSRLA